MGIQRVSIPVQTRAPSGRTNAYLVKDGEGLLVDPAAPTDRLRTLVSQTDPAHVAVTHTHPDHVAGVARLSRDYDLTVWARSGRVKRFERATGISPDRVFSEGTRIGPATVLETPGHAPDHVTYALPPGAAQTTGEALITGDLAVETGSVFVGDRDGDLRAYLTSLRRLLVRRASICHPAHGPPITDPEATLRRLLAHRRDRERRVLAAVQDGTETPVTIVAQAYDRDLGEYADLAEETVRAHLTKLDLEGHLSWNGDRATMT